MAEREQLLSGEQVDAVMQFSQALYAMDNYGLYTPWLQNNLLQDLNNSAKTAKIEDIKKALEDYRNQADNLQDYTEFMQKWSSLYNKTISYLANILSFDLEVICNNAYTPSDLQSEEFAEDRKKIDNFLTSFDYKAEFSKVVKQLLRNEVYYTWFRKTKWGNKGMKFALQVMPQDRCILTGYWEKGLLYSFDMNYFLQPGVDIDTFDPAFKKYYNNVFGPESELQHPYRPSSPLAKQTGTFAMITQTSPEDGSWAFKLDPSNFNATPFLASLLKSAIRAEDLAELQYNKDIAGAYAILAGEIRLLERERTGDVKDQFAINPKTLGDFMRKAKQGLGDKTMAVALPLENTNMYQYQDHNVNAYSNQLKNTAGEGASASRLIYSSDRMSNAELENAILTDYNMLEPIYSQFNNFLDFFANKLTKKYKFTFVFKGSNYWFERQKRIDNLIKYADKGIVLNSSAFASAIGMRPQDFRRSLMEGHSDPEFLSNLSMLLNANTMKDGGTGRPTKDLGELTDSGEDSQMYS